MQVAAPPDLSLYERVTAGSGSAHGHILSRLPAHQALKPKTALDPTVLTECLDDGAGILNGLNASPLFSPEEVLAFVEAGACVTRIAEALGSQYRPGLGFGYSLSLFRLIANLERCVGPRRYRILEICPGGSWFGMLALQLGHRYAATETRPDYYLARALMSRYFAGEKFADWSQLESQPRDLAAEATVIPWWRFIHLPETLSFGVDIVIWREPSLANARYDVEFALRLSRLMLKTSELGLFICQGPRKPDLPDRPLPILDHYEKFGFKKAFLGEWCGFVPEEVPSDPRLADLGIPPAPYNPSSDNNRFTAEDVIASPLSNAIACLRQTTS